MSCTDPAHQFLVQRNEALEKRIAFLSDRLEQRYQETISEYQDKRKFFDSAQQLVLQMFLDLPPGTGLTRTEIVQMFKLKFPNAASVDALRRGYELVEMGKLWKKQEQDAVRFYLKLKETEPNDTTDTFCTENPTLNASHIPTRDHRDHAALAKGACQVLNGDSHR
jgi:hypothetical protein